MCGTRLLAFAASTTLADEMETTHFTKPINVMTVPHATMIEGNQMEGRNFLSIMLLGTSKAQ